MGCPSWRDIRRLTRWILRSWWRNLEDAVSGRLGRFWFYPILSLVIMGLIVWVAAFPPVSTLLASVIYGYVFYAMIYAMLYNVSGYIWVEFDRNIRCTRFMRWFVMKLEDILHGLRSGFVEDVYIDLGLIFGLILAVVWGLLYPLYRPDVFLYGLMMAVGVIFLNRYVI